MKKPKQRKKKYANETKINKTEKVVNLRARFVHFRSSRFTTRSKEEEEKNRMLSRELNFGLEKN